MKRRPGAAAGRLGARAAGAGTRGRGTGRTTDSRRSGRTGGGSGGSWGDTARTALSRTTGDATGAAAASLLVAPQLSTQAVATAPPTTTRPSTPMGTQRRRRTGSVGSSGSSSRSSSSPASGEPTMPYSAGAPPLQRGDEFSDTREPVARRRAHRPLEGPRYAGWHAAASLASQLARETRLHQRRERVLVGFRPRQPLGDLLRRAVGKLARRVGVGGESAELLEDPRYPEVSHPSVARGV